MRSKELLEQVGQHLAHHEGSSEFLPRGLKVMLDFCVHGRARAS